MHASAHINDTNDINDTNEVVPSNAERDSDSEPAAHLREGLAGAATHEADSLRTLAREHDMFISTFAHDIKNPLTTVMGRVELLKRLAKREHITSDDVTRHLEPLEAAVLRLEELIQRFSKGFRGGTGEKQ